MILRDDTERRDALLHAYHKEFIRPELVRLNRLPKLQAAEEPEIEAIVDQMAKKGAVDRDTLLGALDQRDKAIGQRRESRLERPSRQPVLTEDELCASMLKFAVSHNRKADTASKIHQLQPFHEYAFTSNERHDLVPDSVLFRPIEGLRTPTRELEPEKEHAYIYLNGTDGDTWLWTESNDAPYQQDHVSGRSFGCWPEAGKKPSIYMKFSSRGLYFLESDPNAYPEIYEDSEARVSISFKMTYGQIRIKPSVIEAWHRTETWSILDVGGRDITQSDWIDGAQFWYIDHPSGYEIWDEPLFVDMRLTLSCSVRDWAWTILDFRGWEDSPYWYLFDVWVLGAAPL